MANLITVAEAAEVLGVHTMTVRRWAGTGQIPAKRIGGQWRIDRGAVMRLIGETPEVARPAPQSWKAPVVSEWVRNRLDEIRGFVASELRTFGPDYIIYTDRKAQLFETLGLIPESYAQNIFYPSGLRFMDPQSLQGKKVLVCDDTIQTGRGLRLIREDLKRHGATARSLTLVRRRSIYESGGSLEPSAVACMDLLDSDFAYATAQLSATLSSSVSCLDTDHFPSCQLRFVSAPDFERIGSILAELGELSVLPSPLSAPDLHCMTLDNPGWFSWEELALPTSMYREGVSKLRIYFERLHDGGGVLRLVPVAFPAALWPNDEPARLIRSRNTPWAPYLFTPGHWERMAQSRQAEFLYRCLIVYASTKLLGAMLGFLHERANDLSLDPSRHALLLEKEALRRILGPESGELAARVNGELADSWAGRNPHMAARGTPRTPASSVPVAEDGTPDMSKVADLLVTFDGASDPARGMSRSEMISGLGITPHQASRILDYGLDRGLLRPLIEVRVEGDAYRCLRTYRAAEPLTRYGSWQSGGAYTDEMLAARQTSLIIPAVFDRLMASTDSLQAGIPDTLVHKVLTNLQHDWDHEHFEPLYLPWVPHYFGPMALIPGKHRPDGGFISVKDFCVERGTCESLRDPRDGRPVMVPHRSGAWREGLASDVPHRVLDYVFGLADIYGEVYRLFKDRADPLITLSACRNEHMTYVCAYQGYELWKENIAVVIEQLRLHGNRPGGCDSTKLIENAAAGRTQIGDKIARYERLPEARRLLDDLLRKHPRYPLALAILSEMDETPRIEDSGPTPLGRLRMIGPLLDHTTSLVHTITARLRLAKDKRSKEKQERNGWFYLDRLRAVSPHLVTEELETAVRALDEGEAPRQAVDAIDTLFRAIVRHVSRLPEPRAHPIKDPALAGVLEAASRAAMDSPTGILYVDLQPFVVAAFDYAEATGSSRDEAGARVRNQALETINRVLRDVALTPLRSENVGGDGWLILHNEIDTLLAFAGRLQHVRATSPDGPRPAFKVAVTYGTPRIEGAGAAIGEGFIRAYYVAEKTGMAPGSIRITPDAMERVRTPELRESIRPLPDQYDLRSFGKSQLFELDWVAYMRSE